MNGTKSCFMRAWQAMTFALLSLAFVSQGAMGAIVVYSVNMNGGNESPANGSPGIGSGTVTFNDVAKTMTVNVTFSGLIGTTTNAHIHAATSTPFTGIAGVATQTPTFVGFPSGVTSGTYAPAPFDMSLAASYNAAYLTANGGTPDSAFSALMAAAASNRAYFNIHSSAFAGGEIRGFLIAVPEPSSMLLTGLVIGVGVLYRRSRIKNGGRA